MKHIVAMSVVEQGITAYFFRSERLGQAIFKKAFRGELVSQDSNDEPGSVLLSRIQKQPKGSKRG